jgi:uncharacterized membrane protein
MEWVVQFFDDIDDLVSMLGLVVERLRKAFRFMLLAIASVALPAGGIALALLHPPIALGTAFLMLVSLFYHVVTSPRVPLK